MLTVPPVQPVQPVTTRADALVLRVEHWTPKGDYAERGDKKDIEMNGTKLKNYQKKAHQKIEIMFNFI